jgi:hypothetical protein
LTTLKLRDLTCVNIERLKNAPALKTLELCNGTIFLGHIDCIHRNTPGLVSLKVYHLIITEITLGDLVDPAITITEFGFRIFRLKSGGSGAILFQYICRKYPNLSQLIYQADYLSSGALNNSGLRDILWTFLIQQFGPQLKKLGNIQVTDSGTDIFSVMEAYNVQLDYLGLYDFKRHVLQILARSTQSLCLQSLELFTSENMSFEWLKQLSMLKILKLIGLSQTDINLSKILANAPLTLRSLHIVAGFLVKDSEYVEASNIEELCFEGVKVNINPDTHFSHHFPKLTSLTLKNPDPFSIKLNLSNIRLYEFRVYYLEAREGRYFVYISTEKEGRVEKKLYYVKKKHCDLTNLDERFLPAPRILPLNSATGYVPTIDLICKSVDRVTLT